MAESRKKYRARMRREHGANWYKSKGGPKLRGTSVWTLTSPHYGGMTYTKKVVATDESKGPEFVGTAWAEPRKGFGRWSFDIYKIPDSGHGDGGFFVKNTDFPENRGPHPTLHAALEAVQEDAFMTGT
jgi:hypothetical protein